jgi:uncharacterized protein (DUF2062 family)
MVDRLAGSFTVLRSSSGKATNLSKQHLNPMSTATFRPLVDRLPKLLRAGLTPEKLALSLALGAGISCFPVFGTTTILCALVAMTFRLNLPAIQVGNYLALPLQLALLVPFLRVGERLVGAPRMTLSPEQLLLMARSSPQLTAHLLLTGQWHAILGWLLVAPGITLILVCLLSPALRLIAGAADRQEASNAPRT